jgi:hypothetical protein
MFGKSSCERDVDPVAEVGRLEDWVVRLDGRLGPASGDTDAARLSRLCDSGMDGRSG